MSSNGSDTDTRTAGADEIEHLEDELLAAVEHEHIGEVQDVLEDAKELNAFDDEDFKETLREGVVSAVSLRKNAGKIAKMLLPYVDLEARDSKGLYIEHEVALARGHSQLDVMKEILNATKDPNRQVEKTGETVLHLVDNQELTKFLVKAGSRTDLKTKDGETPLQRAKSKKNLQVQTVFEEEAGSTLTTPTNTNGGTSALTTSRSSLPPSAHGHRRTVTGSFVTLPRFEPTFIDAAPGMKWKDWCDNHSAPKLGRYIAATYLLLRQMHGHSDVSPNQVLRVAAKPTSDVPEMMDLLLKKSRIEAELTALDQEIIEKEGRVPKARDVQVDKNDEEHIRALFDRFDVDRSGTIDATEFRNLASECGEVLDDDEVMHVLGIIDSNKSGKVSYEEFYEWWTSDYSTSDKTFLQVRDLQAKLRRSTIAKDMNDIITKARAAAQAVKMPSGPLRKGKKEEVTKFNVEVTMGDFKKEKAHANIEREILKDSQVKSALNLAKAPKNTVSMVQFEIKMRPGIQEVEFGEVTGALRTLLAAALPRLFEGLYLSFDVKSRKKTMTIDIYFSKDIRQHYLSQLGVDYQVGSVRKLSARVSFDTPVQDFINGKDTRINQFFNSKVELKVDLEKAAYKQLVVLLKALQPHEMYLDSLLYFAALREINVKSKFHNMANLLEDFITNLPTSLFAGWPRHEVGDSAQKVNEEGNRPVEEVTRAIKKEFVNNLSLSGGHMQGALKRMVPVLLGMLTDPEAGASSAPWFMVPILSVLNEQKVAGELQKIITDKLGGVHNVTFIMPQEKYSISTGGLDLLQMLPPLADQAKA